MNDQCQTPGDNHSEKHTAAGTAFLATDWTKLQHGDMVWVRQKGRRTSAGRVDTMTADGTVVWIIPAEASTRRMHHRTDADEIWSLRQTSDDAPTIDARMFIVRSPNASSR